MIAEGHDSRSAQRPPAPAEEVRPRQRLQPRRAPRERALPCARQPLRARKAARQLPLLQPAPGRPERSRGPRAPARAARGAGLRRLAESRRLARHQQPRHARDDQRARLGQALHVRLRIHPRQRHRLRPAPPAGQRIHLRAETRVAVAGHAGPVRAAVDDDRLSSRAGSVGRLEAERFDPLKWKPEYPNPAFENMRPDDAFWAARIVSKFSDEAIRAVVEKAAYSDPAATDFMTKTIIARRDKVVAAWINQVCPVVDTALSADGTLHVHERSRRCQSRHSTRAVRAHLVPVRQRDRSADAGRRADDGVERIGPRARRC